MHTAWGAKLSNPKDKIAVNKAPGHFQSVVLRLYEEVNKKKNALLVSKLIDEELRLSHNIFSDFLPLLPYVTLFQGANREIEELCSSNRQLTSVAVSY